MDVAVFSTRSHDRESLTTALGTDDRLRLRFFEPRLTPETTALAAGHEAVCAFVNDDLSAPVVTELAAAGVRFAALRSAGYNHVDLAAAAAAGMRVAHVPGYSPYAVAEHALGLILTLNRHIHRAYNRVREGNFSLEGLMGFDLHGKTMGIIGTGTIGAAFAQIVSGLGMRLLGSDPRPHPVARSAGVEYTGLDELLAAADIITLFAPLTSATHHLIDGEAVGRMKRGAMLVNTSRGALVDTRAVIEGLKSGAIGALGLDVYEEEGPLFFEDRSSTVISDDIFMRLLTFPNVVITGHQAFFTVEAVNAIAATTVANLRAFAD
ncbi:MAG TPA: 2-hydroxyacid dehydrogenase, partial [Euzebyales bacterium]|nr:2-hydroxyacid dehydrogenase [Euzebyales bacterium]